MAYCGYLLKALTRNAALYVYAVVLALLLFLPLLWSLMFPSEPLGFSRPVFRQNYASISHSPSSDILDAMPEATREFYREEERLRGAVGGATDAKAFYDALNDYLAFEAEQPGGLAPMDEAAHRISLYLAEHPDSEVVAIEELPFLFHLPYALGASYQTVPVAVWYLAAVPITLTLADATKRHKLLGAAPVPGWRRFLSQYGAGCLATVAVLLAAYLPSALFYLMQNGLGDPGYPIVFYRQGEFVESTALAAYLEALGMLVLGNLVILSVSMGVAHLSKSGLAGAVCALAIACVPLIDRYYVNGLVPEGAMAWLPTSYLDFMRIVAYPTVFPTTGPGGDVPLVFSPERGPFVLALWLVASLAAFTLAAGGFTRARPVVARACDRALSASDVSLAYGRHVVYEGADIRLPASEVRGFVAPNGWGKTTLMRALSEQPLRGRRAVALTLDGQPASDLAVRREVLYAASDGELLHPGFTVRDHLRMAKRLWGSALDVDEVAEALAITGFLSQRTRRLSQGMRQQAVLAIALMCGARYLLLDEPTNGLDPTNVVVFERAVRQMAAAGRGILVSSHVADVLDELCDGCYFIRDRRLVWVERSQGLGSADGLVGLFEAFYGTAREQGAVESAVGYAAEQSAPAPRAPGRPGGGVEPRVAASPARGARPRAKAASGGMAFEPNGASWPGVDPAATQVGDLADPAPTARTQRPVGGRHFKR